jgi:hypothetical protein
MKIFLSRKKFCEKLFQLNFDKKIKFADFHNIMKQNVENNIQSKKLESILGTEGFESTKQNIEELSKGVKKVYFK